MPSPHENGRASCNGTHMHKPNGNAIIQSNRRPHREGERELYSRRGCVYTLKIRREMRAERRDNERQPFAGISITNTHQTTGDRRNRRGEGTQ